MPFNIKDIWNITTKYIFTNKKVGIGTDTPQSLLDVNGYITENNEKLEDKYTLNSDNNKNENLYISDTFNNDHNYLDIYFKNKIFIWFKFNKLALLNDELKQINITNIPTIQLSKDYIIGNGSAKFNNNFIQFNNSLYKNSYTITFWIKFNQITEQQTIFNLNSSFQFKIINNNLYFSSTTARNTNDTLIDFDIQINNWYHISLITYQYDTTIPKENIDNQSLIIQNELRDYYKLSSGDNYTTDNISRIIFLIDGIITYDNQIINDTNISENFNYFDFPNTNNSINQIGGSNLNAYIDDFRIYETALTKTQIQNNIIGKYIKLHNNTISAISNYGINIENFNNKVNIGNSNNPVDLQIYGNTLINKISNNLYVENQVFENQKSLINKYLLQDDRDKNTDIMVSSMINSLDTFNLYMELDEYFRKKLLIKYNFDFNENDLKDYNHYKKNTALYDYDNNISLDGNLTSNIILTADEPHNLSHTFANINLQFDTNNFDYGQKYVKGTSSLYLDGNRFYYFDTNTNNSEYDFRDSEYLSLTMMFWFRLININDQTIFNIGNNPGIILKLINNQLKLYINNQEFSLININKDKWYHFSLILYQDQIIFDKNQINSETTDIFINNYNFIENSQNQLIQNKLIKGSDWNINIYIDGLLIKYHSGISNIFNIPLADSFNYLGSDNQTNSKMYGYIDDFRIYNTLVPIEYINKYIIGSSLILTSGNISAIGNYGIQIENFKQNVNIGNSDNHVNLNIYGNTIGNNGQYNILNVQSNISSNLNSEIATINTLNVTGSMDLKGVQFKELDIISLSHNNTLKVENDNVDIYCNLNIGNVVQLYDYNNLNNLISFYTGNQFNHNLHVNIYDKSFNFHIKDSNIPDLRFTNTLTNPDINASEFTQFMIDNRNTTRIKLDIGNIDISNGYILIQNIELNPSLPNFQIQNLNYIKIEENIISLFNDTSNKIKIDHTGYYYCNNDTQTTLNQELIFNDNTNFSVFNSNKLKVNEIEVNTISIGNNAGNGNSINSSGSMSVNNITTTNEDQNIISIDTGINLGKIRGKLSDNSIIDITGNIKTTDLIHCSTLKVDNSIEFDNINGNIQIDADLIVSDTGVVKVQYNNVNGNTFTGIEFGKREMKFNIGVEDKEYFKLSYTGFEYWNDNILNTRIISNDFTLTTNDKIYIKCGALEVEKLITDENQFSFPNIISYGKNSTEQIANVFVGYQDINETNNDNTKDVLHIDTPNNSRLRTGNILIEGKLQIGSLLETNSLNIISGGIQTLTNDGISKTVGQTNYVSFLNSSDEGIMYISLKNNSVGIGIEPPNIDNTDVKLYVNGSIQSSSDIIGFASISDKRFKNNIIPIDNAIDIVNKMNPVTFTWNNDLFNSNMANKNDVGFIAQEIEEIIPYAISQCKIETNDIDYKYIKYERLIPYLVSNIQLLNKKVQELENKLNQI